MKTPEEERLENEVRRLQAELAELRANLDADETAKLQHALGSLRESEARYRSVIAALTEGVVLQAADGSILTCNPAAEDILGMTVDQMMGRTSLDPRWRAIHPDGSPFAGDQHPAMVTLRTGEQRHNVPMGVHKPDGSLTWISINTQPLLREGAARPYAVVSSFTDITEFRTVQQALERSARQLNLALSSARVGVWEWDITSNEVWWSDGVEGLFGLDPGEFDGTYQRYLELVHPDDRELVQERIRLALEGEIERYEVEHRLRPRSKSSRQRWYYASGAVLRDTTGKPLRMSGAVLDITDSKDLELRLLHAQKMESVGRLAGGVAHDFNNLLTAVLVSAELALDQLDEPEEVREHLDSIYQAAEQGSRLTRQLLSFARKQVLSLAPLRVGTIISDCHGLLRRLLGEHIALELRCTDTSLVNADPGQLEQVLVNLAVNAREAMHDGGHLSIEVRDLTLDPAYAEAHPPALPGPHVELTVADTGSGIAPELLEKVFEPFFTTKADGSGLGLATCHGIVSQLGGHMTITSEPGRGTTIRAYLPSKRDGVEAPDEAAPREPTHSRGNETVLLVEDDFQVLSSTRQALAKYGYRPLEADSPQRALELAAAHAEPIELLISDVLMPGMTGVELAERLVADRPDMRVLLVSGYSDQHLQSVVGGRELNFLQKPFTVAELVNRVNKLLDEQRG